VPVIPGATAPTFSLPGLVVTGLAAPSRGATETSVWHLVLEPGAPGVEHSMDREEVFVAVAGRALATVGGDEAPLAAGDALVVPAGRRFSLANPSAEPFRAVVALPVGGRASMPGQAPFVPPWAE
jgi:mannose-6-phosphate isomerase-like protein (cupin superfamily)